MTHQENINIEVAEHFLRALADRKEYNAKQLRSCNARVAEGENYYLLISYTTPVACIDKATGICYDALRKVYGYTATSAQHIAKFRKDYGNGESVVYRV